MNLGDLLRGFMQHDALRRSGMAEHSRMAALKDREAEGALVAGLLGPVAPIATVPVAAAGLGYEGIKALGQRTGLGQYLPGPFTVDETTSPANIENVTALLKGFTGEATGQRRMTLADLLRGS